MNCQRRRVRPYGARSALARRHPILLDYLAWSRKRWHMRKRTLAAAWTVLAAGVLGAAPPAQAGEDRGRALALSCFGCHGPDGSSAGSIPTIAGLPGTVIGERLREFRSGQRPATIMDRIARGYTDAEIDALARYPDRLLGDRMAVISRRSFNRMAAAGAVAASAGLAARTRRQRMVSATNANAGAVDA